MGRVRVLIGREMSVRISFTKANVFGCSLTLVLEGSGGAKDECFGLKESTV